VPYFVRKVGIGRHNVDFCTHFLEFGVIVSSVFYFGRAVEGKSGWHENDDRPFALHGFVGYFYKLTIVKGLGFEGLNLGIDNGHRVSFGGW